MARTALYIESPPTPESKKSTLFALTLLSDNLRSLLIFYFGNVRLC